MTLPYTSIVPQGSQQVNQTQLPIETNFQSISDYINVNHVGFNQTLEGNHTYVSYVGLSSDPATSSTEMVLYAKPVANDPNIIEWFYRYPSSGTIVQLTGVTSNTVGTGGGTFQNHSGSTGTATDSWGYGFWQYMSNGVLIMGWAPVNQIATGQGYSVGTGIPLIIPSGYGAPSFTQTPFNVQFTQAGGPSALNSSIVAASAISPTTINLYNAYGLGTASTGGANSWASIFMFAIGV